MRTALLAMILGSVVTACHDRTCDPGPLVVGGAAARDHEMTMTGTATLEVAPDCVDVSITVSSDELLPAAATAQVGEKQRALLATLGKLGLANADLKLSTLTLAPVRNAFSYEAAKRVITYRADVTIMATTHDFRQLTAILQAGADAGATNASTQFRSSELPVLKRRVRDMAIAAVQAKAKQTADALGIRLGAIVGVNEASGASGRSSYAQQVTNVARATDPSGGTGVGAELEPLTLDVTVTYLIGPTS